MINKVLKMSDKLGNPRTPFEILSKATEELGEVATILNKPNKEHDEPLYSEVCDVINAVVDLAWTHHKDEFNGDRKAFMKVMKKTQKKKLLKWENRFLLWRK
ncbi:MazG-like pyrophosphatase [Vibrio phage Vp_R1]|uniref:NTP pyrophosphohydrolase MazG putative catalytic core domain-containing protein n=1 Tax=Vibrio phage Vp_R1 TaxID=2059867 RepID=A0A2H5BPV6_9CAUD|nr:MazG-like pyrophosphatase [Vibrio phage Vp_R1]AUG88368.1 hypothetical protein VPR_004 [Vibrio phage Vp_R1]